METKFNGELLVKVPKYNPNVGFLEGHFGKEFLKEYQGRVKDSYRDNTNLKVLNESDGLIKGSNPFAVVLVNELLNKEGLRTATQADLELILKYRSDLDLRGTYEDTGLVLRSEADPNSYLASDLIKQLKQRDKKIKYPVLVNLTDLTLRVDPDSDYGLSFKLREKANPIYAPILNQEGKFSSNDLDESTGLPKQIGSGNRTLYTREAGLSRLCLDRGLYLSSDSDDLTDSVSGGRVVVVSGVATQKNSE